MKTQRDVLAEKILVGFASNSSWIYEKDKLLEGAVGLADLAYKMADAFIQIGKKK